MTDDHLHHHAGDPGFGHGTTDRATVRPGRAISLLTAIVAGFILLTASQGFGRGLPTVFVVAIVGIIGFHLYNTFGGANRPPLYDIDLTDAKPSQESSVEVRLARLEELNRTESISADEYEAQRQRILDDL